MARTISIRIRTNARGKQVAHYWGEAKRCLPLSVAQAEIAISTGSIFGCKAVRSETTSDPLPAGYIHTSIDGDVFDRR